jgi:hypothetical protein
MNVDELFAELSNNQRKLVKELLDNPEGLLSRELALRTGVSNKSATMPPEVREILEQHGLELVIERSNGRNALWSIRYVDEAQRFKDNIAEHLDSIVATCEELKKLLC